MLEFLLDFAIDLITWLSFAPIGRWFVSTVSFGYWSCEDEIAAGIIGAVLMISLIVGIAIVLSRYT